MFAKVLFPTDFSSYADAVLACLPDLRAGGMREVVLLHVIRSSEVPMPETVNRDSLELARWSAEQRLTVARLALEGYGLRVTSRVEYGSPVEQIVRVAAEEGVGTIIIGAQGRTLAQELLLGSTAFEVVRRATTPVLIQKFDVIREVSDVVCRRLCERMFSRVLHPTDFSECAAAAFAVVKDLKDAGAEEAILLHVQDQRAMANRSSEAVAAFDREDATRLKAMSLEVEARGMKAETLVRHGIPFRETLAVAEEKRAGLIVLGSRGRSAIREMLAGSTFENVVRSSRYPVLVVRRPQS